MVTQCGSERRGCRRALLRMEVLEDRLTPSGPPQPLTIVALPDVPDTLNVQVQQSAVLLSDNDGLVASQISWPGKGTLELVGADGDDSLAVTFSTLARGVTRPQVLLVGGNGQNTATLTGTAGNDQATLQGSSGSLQAGGFTLLLQNLQNITVVGNGGLDQVTFTDPPGAGTFTVGPAGAVLTDSQGDVDSAQGFPVVTAVSNQSGQDSATINGMPGWDVVTFTPQQTSMYTILPFYQTQVPNGPVFTVNGFANLDVNGNAGGQDVLQVHGSMWNETLTVPNNGQGSFVSPGHFTLDFAGFQVENFWANPYSAATVDQAFLTDGPGNDTFVANGWTGTYLDDQNLYQVFMSGFNSISVDGSNGGVNVLTRQSVGYQLNITDFTLGATFFTGTANLAAIKAVTLQLDPALAQVTDPLTLAIDLRDFIYQRLWVGTTDPSWLYESPYVRFVQAIVQRDVPIECQGAQILYADLAEAFGIPARYVAMYATVDGATHASDEVLIGGTWIAMDPFFDVAYVSPTTGQYLNYGQLKAGVPYVVTHNGMPERDQPNYESFPIPLQALLQDIAYPPQL